MDLLAIRQALADVVAQVVENSYPHPVRSPNTPCAVIEEQPGEFIDYLLAFKGGLVAVKLRITLLASLADDEGTARISSWLSTGTADSIPDLFMGSDPQAAAIVANRTLGGLVGDLVIRRAENAGWVEVPPGTQTWFKSAEIPVDISL